MKVHQMLICIFILSLQDGNTGLINAETITVTEGGNITHACDFFVSGSRKIFCKEGCEEKDILVETTGDRAQRGRYSIKWKKAANILTYSVLYVSITNLTKSDSGRYTCRINRDLFLDSIKEFEIRVEDALITEPNRPLSPRPPSVPSTFAPTTTQSSNFVPRSSTPSSASTDTSSQSGERHRTAATVVQLCVRLTLFVIFIVSSAAVLIFCRRRASKAEDPPVEAEYVNVTEANPVYEELREDRRSRSPPEEISAGHNLPSSQFAEDSV